LAKRLKTSFAGCASVQSVYSENVEATLTELRRETSKVIRPVIHGGETLTLTEHGQEVATIIPRRKVDYAQACKDLMAIGPVELPAR
jgi:prevent-host-death family protein